MLGGCYWKKEARNTFFAYRTSIQMSEPTIICLLSSTVLLMKKAYKQT